MTTRSTAQNDAATNRAEERFYVKEIPIHLWPFRVYDRTRAKWFSRGFKDVESAQKYCDKRNEQP